MAEEGEVHLRELERLGVKLRESEEALREAERAQTDLEEAHSDHRAELERMRAQLHRSEAALADQRAETQRVLEQAALDADAYDERIAEIQRQLEKFETAARTATERMVAATSGGKQDSAGRVELNTITVEGLRQLGLSITQAARLVHHREARGGFRSTADLDDVPGLPAEHRADLANRVYVDESLAGL